MFSVMFQVKRITEMRCLQSCLRAVRRAPNNCNLIIYTDCVYVCTGKHPGVILFDARQLM